MRGKNAKKPRFTEEVAADAPPATGQAEATNVAETLGELRAEITALRERVEALEQDVEARRDVLDMQSAAQLLGVSVKTIQRRIRDGRIPHVRVGNAKQGIVRIIRADLLKAMRAGFPERGTPRLHSRMHYPGQRREGNAS